jgi:hypothetical protein
MAGDHFIEGRGRIDAFANAATILSGMGPLDPIKTTAGKLFAGAYAIVGDGALPPTVGLLLAPVVHRFLHLFHLESKPRE